MSTLKTIISGIGSRGEKLVNELKSQGFYEADFMSSEELIENSSINIFILYIIYDPEDKGAEMVDKITIAHVNKRIIEIILTDKTDRKTPHYIVNNLSIDVATKKISTFIKTFTDLGRYSALACIDPADIMYSLKNAKRLQMQELDFESDTDFDAFNKFHFLQKTFKKIETVWVQIYIQKNDSSFRNIHAKLLDALDLILDEDVDILWNVSDEGLILNAKNKYVVIYS